ncbi:inositol monophosphatase family protein [Ovoidimarina sediminis]|uniref:inositol monophosphatase family protein n=1 Tax=Ovoidimarina sediminis TaxID=3079856 RepID=UPI00290F16AE|nr:inositol monophosphatase family protein [Rhodophyticola sp. MJ-SS7]MDU8945401.1 inositol monophosphatase family protein [Rhodophyticola sp. MJ-SS7]
MTGPRHSLTDRPDSEELVEVVHALCDAARAATLSYFRSDGLNIASKAEAFDPVTEADRAAEEAMRDILHRRRPDDAILGEEFAAKPGTSGLTWVLDPIDGTRGFMSGTPTWGVLVAVATETGPILGAIDQPYIGERFFGGLGHSFVTGPLGQRPLAVKPPRPLAEATMLTTFPEVGTAEEGRAFRNVAGKVRLVRYGLDCYGYALVAAGQVDLVIEAGLQPYDIAAPLAVVEAAGGVVTDWAGGPAHGGGRVIAAANEAIHAEALTLLREIAG